MPDSFANDVAAVARIDIVPTVLEVVCRMTGMRFSAIARVTEERWIACAVRDEIEFGLEPGGELDLETTLCSEIRKAGQLIVIDNVAEDDRYCGHATPKTYGFQSYISVPIRRPNGDFFGTLCAIDPRPASLDRPETIGLFTLSAELIGFHLDLQERLDAKAAALAEAERTAERREQFVAVLGHDLRSPLSSIDAGIKLLQRRPLDAKGAEIVELMSRSVLRMTDLIGDVLDFARVRLGDGIRLTPEPDRNLGEALGQVVEELRSAWPERAIEAEIALDRPVTCERARLAQLLSNLLSNALTHGDPEAPVRVRAGADGQAFELSVANAGAPIPEDARGRLFQPFSRPASGPANRGLGLGLYIASEIAQAHGGTLGVASDAAETRFTFRMPLEGPGAPPQMAPHGTAAASR
ncbi:MAG: GAF domain-containing sensor histidine kinase [Tistlia sp.]|uniref:GAF domain-containing sensor histidine kinase n=1 Tax=Tistlia sp. TaxID=3057121 RepID=UPI0034A3B391